MRPSPLRHPVAVLRAMLKLGQAELGEICQCSARTVQAVELRKLPLSENLATKISQATGVSVEWLLNGDPAAQPIADYPSAEMLYTYEVFEARRAAMEVEAQAAAGAGRENTSAQILAHRASREALSEHDAGLVALCTRVLEESRYDERSAVLRWKLKKFLGELAAQHEAGPKPVSSKRPSRRRHPVTQPRG